MIREKLSQYMDLVMEVQEIDQRLKAVDKTVRLHPILMDRKVMCEDQIQRVEDFIDNIPDAVTKAVFVLRYIDKLSWNTIAHTRGKSEESYPRKMIHDKYLNNFRYKA